MQIKAFKAFRFDSDVVGDAVDCVAPPYDVISDAQQQRLYEKNDHNIVRIIKGKTNSSDNDKTNQYTRAADYLNDWIDTGALREDVKEAIYGYVQDFEISEKKYQRLSFIASAKPEEFGQVVRPHEKILEKPMIDRLNLLKATSAKFGLVFMMYEDKDQVAERIIEKATQSEALIDFVDEQGVRHRLFELTDEKDILAITVMMADKSCIIADGHHRYTTGLAYSKQHPEAGGGCQMMAFSNICHEGMIVLATHRLVSGLADYDFGALLEGLEKNFEMTKHSFERSAAKEQAKEAMLEQLKEQLGTEKNAFGIYSSGEAFYVAVLKDVGAMDIAVPQQSRAWRSLDVTVLHKLILEELLGIDEKKLAIGGYVQYVKDTHSAIDDSIAKVDAGEKQAAFFMNPPRLEQIQKVADEGERMPQKSTYFYPKVYSGLTINKL